MKSIAGSFFLFFECDKGSESIAMTSMMMTMMTVRRNFRLWGFLKKCAESTRKKKKNISNSTVATRPQIKVNVFFFL